MWDQINWKAWTPFYTVADIKDGCEWWRNSPIGMVGVYRIVALNSDWPNKDLASIQRSCGIDAIGTLYIGQGWINNRVSNHILNHRSNHPLRLRMWSPALLSKFPIERRAVSWHVEDNLQIARERESELLKFYWDKFGELPPVNLNRS